MSPRSLRVSKLHGAGNDFLVTVGTADRGPDAGLRCAFEFAQLLAGGGIG